MRKEIAGPHLVPASSGRTRRTVLVTGASGVVGQALLPRLHDFEVICLVHRAPVKDDHAISLRGDITESNLGLSEAEYSRLIDRVDAVIHCAAVTDFNRTDGSLELTNIGGTQNMVAFCNAANAILYHVSTAFVFSQATGSRGQTAIGYASSKFAAEDMVRASGIPHVILRPSVVIGDSHTGEIAAFQGVHQVAAGVFAGWVPMIPFEAAWPLDFVPSDVVADAIATVVEQEVQSGEFWITAGERALRLDEAVAVGIDLAHDLGIMVDAPRFVPPELFDRLIGPVFLDALPPRMKTTVLRMLEFFTTYLQSGQTMPSSMDELVALGAMALPDQRSSFRTSLNYWAAEKGYTQDDVALEVA